MPTHKSQSSSLEIVADESWPNKIDYAGLARRSPPDDLSLPPLALNNGGRPSMYVPAGRTGMIQSYANMARIRNALLHSALEGMRSPSSSPAAGGTPGNKKSQKSPSLGKDLILPEYLELFHDAIFQSLAKSPTEAVAGALSRIFGGTVGISKAAGIPVATYTNNDGFSAEITSAASGILSSFPIIACIESVKAGGLLIVEEPEAHLEPARQLLLVEELAAAARAGPFDLILITHSDHTLDSALSLVASGKLRHDDLGLYSFERRNNSHTRIKAVPVEKDGTAEQKLFEDAIESLSRRFV